MVRGIELFKKHFAGQQGKYVLIGGTACDLAMGEAGLQFRATKDLDMVLILEMLDEEFFHVFWNFIEQGKYKNRQKSTGKNLFYRFYDPEKSEYPYMLELFSRIPDFIRSPYEGHIVPIPLNEDVASLSAILLDDSYYGFIRNGVDTQGSISFLSPQYLIPLKAKAFLDLSERKSSGDSIDLKDVNKHRNDVFRLYQLLTPDQKVELPLQLISDMNSFVDLVSGQDIAINEFGIRQQTKAEVINSLKSIYSLLRLD